MTRAFEDLDKAIKGLFDRAINFKTNLKVAITWKPIQRGIERNGILIKTSLIALIVAVIAGVIVDFVFDYPSQAIENEQL